MKALLFAALFLAAPPRLSGQILAPGPIGAPAVAAGPATVSLWVFGANDSDVVSLSTTPGSDGRFEFAPPPGRFVLLAREGLLVGSADGEFAGPHPGPIELPIALFPGARLTGTITGDGPIEGTLTILERCRLRSQIRTTGPFEVVVEPGAFEILAEFEGYLPRRAHLTVAPGEDLHLPPLELERPALIRGRVFDGRGNPLAGVHLVALETERLAVEARSDRLGRFELGPLGRQRITVEVWDRGRVPAIATRAPAEIVVRLPKGVRFSGSTTGPAQIYLEPTDGRGGAQQIGARTEGGPFAIDDVPKGTYRVLIEEGGKTSERVVKLDRDL